MANMSKSKIYFLSYNVKNRHSPILVFISFIKPKFQNSVQIDKKLFLAVCFRQ